MDTFRRVHLRWPSFQVNMITMIVLSFLSPKQIPASSSCTGRCMRTIDMLQALYTSNLPQYCRIHGGYSIGMRRNPNTPGSFKRSESHSSPEAIIAELQSMGAPKGRAILAAQRTAYVSTESALQWLIKNMDDPLFQDQVNLYAFSTYDRASLS
jgi:hypothetical protein